VKKRTAKNVTRPLSCGQVTPSAPFAIISSNIFLKMSEESETNIEHPLLDLHISDLERKILHLEVKRDQTKQKYARAADQIQPGSVLGWKNK